MANFLFSKSSGTGNDTVEVRANATNTGKTDRTTRVTIGVDAETFDTVTITQYGTPSIERAYAPQRVIPAAGEDVPYVVTSHYPIVFRSVPAWATIWNSDKTVQYTQGQQISNPSGTYYIRVAANSSTSQRSDSTFNMGHYLRGSLASNTVSIPITQAAAEAQKYITVTGTPRFEWNGAGSSITLNVSASGDWGYSGANSTYFNHTKSASYLSVTPRQYNTSSSVYTETLNFYLLDDTSVSTTVSVTQYFRPTISVPSGTTYTVPSSGGTKSVLVRSDYEWWFGPLPISSYISITNTVGDAYNYGPSNPFPPSASLNEFRFTWSANSGSSRSDSFYIIYKDLNGNAQTLSTTTLTFTQEYPSVHTVTSTSNTTLPSSQSTAIVKVTSTDDWYWVDLPSYITVTDSGGNNANYTSSNKRTGTGSEETYTFTWANWSTTTGHSRSYTVAIAYTGGSTQGPTFTQWAVATAAVEAQEPLTITYTGTGAKVKVSSFYPWYWYNLPSYITAITDGDGNDVKYTSSNRGGIVANEVFNVTFAEKTTEGTRSWNPTIRYVADTTTTVSSLTSIVQEGAYMVSPNSLILPYNDTAEKTFRVVMRGANSSNGWNFTVDSAASSWISVTDYDTHSADSYLKLSCSVNSGSAGRIGTITVTPPSSSGNTNTYTITVAQMAQNVTLAVNPTSYDLPGNTSGNIYWVTVYSLGNWNVTTSVSWILTGSNWSGNAGGVIGKFSFRANDNHTGLVKTGSLFVKDSTNLTSVTIPLTQAIYRDPAYVTPSTTSVDVAYNASQSNTISLSSNCQWTAVSDSNWLTITAGSSGSGDGTITYSVTQNGTTMRVGTITISGEEDTSATVTIYQLGTLYNLIAVPSVINAHRTSGSSGVTTYSVKFINKTSDTEVLSMSNENLLYFQGGWSESIGPGVTKTKTVYAKTTHTSDWTARILWNNGNNTALTVNCLASNPA